MKKALLTLSLALAAATSVSAEVPVLYGVITYSDEESYSRGVYTVDATADAQPVLYWNDGDMIANGGVVYAEGKYYVLSYMNLMGTMYWGYQICDVANKQYDYKFGSDYSVKDAGSAITYDPQTGCTYSICIDETDTTKFTLSLMDLDTGKKTPVARIEKRLNAMAATLDGVLYGIGEDGNLYTVNKQTAELTLVGSTGVIPQSNQSAIIDYDTNQMYWAAYTAEGGFLYTVDVTTGAATKLSTFVHKQQLVGLTLLQSSVKQTAPAQPTDVQFNFEKASLSGEVSFVMPTLNLKEEALEGTLTYVVANNGEVLAEGTASAGETVKAPVSVKEGGNITFTITVKNAAGDASKPLAATHWVGMDVPAAVENLYLSAEGSTIFLSWEQSETGAHGGYVDPAEVSYLITRANDGTVAAAEHKGTSFSETLDIQEAQKFVYAVTPFIGANRGQATLSNACVAGPHYKVPFSDNFVNNPGCLALYTVADPDGDGNTWAYSTYNGTVSSNWTWMDEFNSWLFTPLIDLEAGVNYTLSVEVASEGQEDWSQPGYPLLDEYAGHLSVYLFNDTNTDAFKTLVNDKVVEAIAPETLSSEPFTVETSGAYCLGFHHHGPSNYTAMLLNSISMTAETTGINAVGTKADIKVSTVAGGIAIDNPEGCAVAIYGVDGKLMYSGASSANVQLPAGMYIVRTPEASVKCVVK